MYRLRKKTDLFFGQEVNAVAHRSPPVEVREMSRTGGSALSKNPIIMVMLSSTLSSLDHLSVFDWVFFFFFRKKNLLSEIPGYATITIIYGTLHCK